MSNVLYIEVRYDSLSNSLDLIPANLPLLPGTQDVVWWPTGLPPGALLDIQFLGPATQGPFVTLAPQGELVIGSGNTGYPGGYPYEVHLTGAGPVNPAVGELVNKLQEQIPQHPVRCVYNPSGPPICYEN